MSFFIKRPTVLESFFESSVRCGLQLSDESSNTPRNFTQVFCLTFFLPNLIITRSLDMFCGE